MWKLVEQLKKAKGQVTIKPEAETWAEGPIIIDKPLTIDGRNSIGIMAAISSQCGPVVTIKSSNVTIKNIEINKVSAGQQVSGDAACALVVQNGAEVCFENTEVHGFIRGWPSAEDHWLCPNFIDLGDIKADVDHGFKIRLQVPKGVQFKIKKDNKSEPDKMIIKHDSDFLVFKILSHQAQLGDIHATIEASKNGLQCVFVVCGVPTTDSNAKILRLEDEPLWDPSKDGYVGPISPIRGQFKDKDGDVKRPKHIWGYLTLMRATDRLVELKLTTSGTEKRALRRTAVPIPWKSGQEISLADFEKLGTEIPVSSDTVCDENPKQEESFYNLFLIHDGKGSAIVADSVCAFVPDVQDLRYFHVTGGVRLQWKWPAYCESVFVLKEMDREPDLPAFLPEKNERKWKYNSKTTEYVLLNSYMEDGESFFLPLDEQYTGTWHIVVVAVIGFVLAPCIREDCRCEVIWPEKKAYGDYSAENFEQINLKLSRRPRKILCPYCFTPFPWWHMLLCDAAGSEKPLRLWQRLLALMHFYQGAPESLLIRHSELQKVCPQRCKQVRQSGPRAELDNALFRDFSLHIGLMGSVLAGKSHWIFGVLRRLWAGLAPIDGHTQREYDKMRSKIMGQRARLDRTQPPAPNSVISPLLFQAGWKGGKGKRKFVLALCDVDGERWGVFGEAGKMDYLWTSSGLVLILDPLQMPSVRRFLGKAMPEDAPADEQCEDQITPLNNLLKAFRQRETPPFKTPIAVVVSKGDTIRDRDPVLRESLWDNPTYHPHGTLAYDLVLHKKVQVAVREFLMKHEHGIVENIEGNFEHFAYFCVAPTGCSTQNDRFVRFAPWRVEEPVLWILAKMGLIPVI